MSTFNKFGRLIQANSTSGFSGSTGSGNLVFGHWTENEKEIYKISANGLIYNIVSREEYEAALAALTIKSAADTSTIDMNVAEGVLSATLKVAETQGTAVTINTDNGLKVTIADVTDKTSGLMTPELKGALEGKIDEVKSLQTAKSNTDYVAVTATEDPTGTVTVAASATVVKSATGSSYTNNGLATDGYVQEQIAGAIDGLDVAEVAVGADKTLVSIKEEDGKISTSAVSIQITESQVTGLVDDLAEKLEKDDVKSGNAYITAAASETDTEVTLTANVTSTFAKDTTPSANTLADAAGIKEYVDAQTAATYKAGNGIDFTTSGNETTISAQANAAKAIVVEADGIGVNVKSDDKYIEINNNQIATKGIDDAITAAIEALDVTEVSGDYLTAVSETDGKISATTGSKVQVKVDGTTAINALAGTTENLNLASTGYVDDSIDAAIAGLDKYDAAVAGQYVSSVSEEDGIIRVSRENIPVMGVKSGENVVSLDSDRKIQTTLSLNYLSEDKKLQILGINNALVSEIDATAFIKDGMLDSAELVVNPTGQPEGTYIKLVWNTDSGKEPMYINVTSLIDTYTAGDGLNLNDHQFSVKTQSGNAVQILGDKSTGLVIDSENPGNVVLSQSANGLKASLDMSEYKVKDVDTTADNGVALTLGADGKVGVTVSEGSVASGNDSVVTGGAVYTAIENKIAELDVTNTTDGNKIITSLTQTDGKIAYTTSNADNAVISDYEIAATASEIAATDTIAEAFGKVQAQLDAIDQSETTVTKAANDLMTITDSATPGSNDHAYTIELTKTTSSTAATALATDGYVQDQINALDVTGYVQATVGENAITISGIKEEDGKIAADSSKNVTIDVDGTVSSTNKLATQNTVTTAIEALDVDTAVGASKSGDTVTIKGVKETDGKVIDGDLAYTFEDGAQVNVIETVHVNGVTATVASKDASVTIGASNIAIADASEKYTATDVEGALAEVKGIADTAVQTVSLGTNLDAIASATKTGTTATIELDKAVAAATGSSYTTDNDVLTSKGYVDEKVAAIAHEATIVNASAIGSADSSVTTSNFIKVKDNLNTEGTQHIYNVDATLADVPVTSGITGYTAATATGIATDAYVKDEIANELAWEVVD